MIRIYLLIIGIINFTKFILKINYTIFICVIKYVILWCILKLLTVSKTIEYVTGSKAQSNTTAETTSKPSTSTKPNQKNTKSRRLKRNTSEDPTFSTTLKTPIEDIIEESILEEQQPNLKRKNKTSSSKKSKSDLITNNSEEDSIGYSFFKVKSIEKNSKTTEEKEKKLKKVQKVEEAETLNNEDDIGLSFIPVKDKGGRKIKKTKEILNSSGQVKPTKINELPSLSLIEVPTKKKKYVNESSVKSVEEYQNRIKPITEYRCESKKVDASISYAKVVANSSDTDSTSKNAGHVVSENKHTVQTEEVNNKTELVNQNFDCEVSEENVYTSNVNVKEDISKSCFLELQTSEFEFETKLGFTEIKTIDKSVEDGIEITEDLKYSPKSQIQSNENFENNLQETEFLNNTVETEFTIIKTEQDLSDDDIIVIDDPEETFSNNVCILTKDSKIIESQYAEIESQYSDLVLITSSNEKELETESVVKETVNNSQIDLLEDTKTDLTEVQQESNDIEEFCNTKPFKFDNNQTILKSDLDIENTSIKMSEQTRVLTLNDQEHQESSLYRLEKNWCLQFRLGPSLLGRRVNLYCNYPEESKQFKRNLYRQLFWQHDEGCEHSDDTALYVQITVQLAGSFHYYFNYADEKGINTETEKEGSGFFLVDPVLQYGDNEQLPLNCIQCQTVLAKGLGSFSSWENKLKVTKESGYNMIHFTPIQELGASNSAYSISEQLKLNPLFTKDNGKLPSLDEIEEFVSKIRKEWKMTSICDIVLNHTANESKWLQDHPETTYNCLNCPYLRPAYLLDAALHQFSLDIKKGLYEDKGIPTKIDSEDHLNSFRYHFQNTVLKDLNILELYLCDANELVSEFLLLARKVPPVTAEKIIKTELKLIQDKEYRRLKSTVDMDLALKLYNIYRADCFDEDSRIKRCGEDFKHKLDELNQTISDEINEHLRSAIENTVAGIRYFRIQADGPKFTEITEKTPLTSRYFTDFGTPKSLKEHETIMYSDEGRLLMAHNGWVINADPLRNFAAADSNVYIRRELIAWGDSVKLRYGDKPEDCPYLWEHMKNYVEETAKIFDGVRLDNCHSTPIVVAEYLLDCARRIRPDLYVVAELFTNSDMTDNIFVNRLGITSLIREAMSAWDSHEEGRLVYRYGGVPVGSFHQPNIRPLIPSIAHALFLDVTHDNPSPVEKRSVFDLLPSCALVNMACCASGSSRGYDELVPHHIHVVDETREYTEWTDNENLAAGNLRYITNKSGIIAAKRAINDLHFLLGKEDFSQVYVDQMDPDIVAVTRHCPDTHQSYILVAFTAFNHPTDDGQRIIKPLRVEGILDEIVLEATLNHTSTKCGGFKYSKSNDFVKDSKWINGLAEYEVHMQEHIKLSDSEVFEKDSSFSSNVTQLNFKNFKPGSIVVVRVSLPESMRIAVEQIHKLVNQFSVTKTTELYKIVNKLNLADLNRALYRCGQEERDEGFGFDTYNIPNYGSLFYAGLQGFISLLSNIRPNNDLGHPMCGNLRDGNWMIEYIWKRLKLDEGTKDLGIWIEENTKPFNSIPRYLVPSYFDLIITGVYVLLLEQCYTLMSNFVKNGSTFVRGLALGSVQFAAYTPSALLPTLSPNLVPPKPPTRVINGKVVETCVTLSAGLPHFSVGYMRNWGRDTFISLRGLFILTGRFEEARQHILGYAQCLRHGLIPNLLDGGRNSRFNCRDAVWWWLHCIKEYVEEAPNGSNILLDKVSRIFPTDDSEVQPPGHTDQPLHDVIQEALNTHFQGLIFKERNAGKQIDEHMTEYGFNNQIGVHPETGFVFGGNEWNCGTWMDKMGSSDKAGNRGKPATPRDGSAVELIGLSKAVISWLYKMNLEKKYPYDGVERKHKNGSITKWTFKEWANKIQTNFEKYFWVNVVPVEGEIKAHLINKRGIYKDCFGATQEWTDYQLRCNVPIAMVTSPELFDAKHAWIALEQTEKYLLGPLGMKTLDPEDWAYNGDYDNSNDSDDFKLSHGFNYHQGPEWVWPIGFFLRAKLNFASQNGVLDETVKTVKTILSRQFVELQTSEWRGLPELTNSNGSFCKDSSRTQAWSMACVLEVLHDLQKIEFNIPNSNN